MGGAAAGEIASAMATEVVLRELDAQWRNAAQHDAETFARAIKSATEAANARIHRYATEHPENRGMGTTATIAGLLGDTLYLAQVGDSRAYLVRDGVAQQITKDQSLMQKLVEAGELTVEEAEVSERRNIILQALGPEPLVKVDLTHQQVRRGDVLVLCSDGLYGPIRTTDIARVVAEEPDLVNVCKKLIDLANEAGGPDNITVIAVRFDGAGLGVASSDEGVGHQAYTSQPESRATVPVEAVRGAPLADGRVPEERAPHDLRHDRARHHRLAVPDDPPLMRVELRITRGSRAGQRELFDKSVISIGRHPLNDLRFDLERDADASSRHAEIRVLGDKATMRDLQSTNGTFVNGQRVDGERALVRRRRHCVRARGPGGGVPHRGGAAPSVGPPHRPRPAPPRRDTGARIAEAVEQQTGTLRRMVLASAHSCGRRRRAYWIVHRDSAQTQARVDELLRAQRFAQHDVRDDRRLDDRASRGARLGARGVEARDRPDSLATPGRSRTRRRGRTSKTCRSDSTGQNGGSARWSPPEMSITSPSPRRTARRSCSSRSRRRTAST